MTENNIPEFDRFGSVSKEDYVAGLKAELAAATGKDIQDAVKAELKRVTGERETADADKSGLETA